MDGAEPAASAGGAGSGGVTCGGCGYGAECASMVSFLFLRCGRATRAVPRDVGEQALAGWPVQTDGCSGLIIIETKKNLALAFHLLLHVGCFLTNLHRNYMDLHEHATGAHAHTCRRRSSSLSKDRSLTIYCRGIRSTRPRWRCPMQCLVLRGKEK